MDDELTQKIMQRLGELPEDVRQAVQSADMAKKIEALGVKYNLHVDQIGELEDETFMVMLGFSTPESFEQRVGSALHLPPETGKLIVEEINRDIFTAVRASLRKFTEQNAMQKPAVDTVPPAQKEIHPADMTLSQKTVTVAPGAPIKPEPYKADPYREPIA